MSESTPQQRILWRAYECERNRMTRIPFGPDQILVAPPTVDAWRALEAVFKEHRYDIRPSDTDSYNCRAITGGTEKSLHSYGIALDVNSGTNPFKHTPGGRLVRFSNKETQAERARDVKLNLADTDMTREMIDHALAIRTRNGKRVFEWGGNWKSVKDAMHFEIDVTPDDMAAGIEWSTVRGGPTAIWGVGSVGPGGQGTSIDVEPGNFGKVHALIEKWEGGFTYHPDDPGGPTNMGITQQVLTEWRGRPASIEDIRNLTRREAQDIFRARYWREISGDELPLAVAQVVYNTAVLSGPRRAVRLLQETLNRQDASLAVGGDIGAETISACQRADQRRLVEDYCDAYEQYLRTIPNYSTFGRGWMNRLAKIRQAALDWAESAPKDEQPIPFDWADLAPPPSTISFGDRGVQVEMLQKRLTELGYTLGEIDGRFGTLTREALLAFQGDNSLAPTGVVDAATQSAFSQARIRQLSRERLMATADDLRKRRSETIGAADNAKIAALISSILGAIGIGNSTVVQLTSGAVPAMAAPPNAERFISEVQQILANRGDTVQLQQVIESAKQLQNFNIRQALTPDSIPVLDNIKAILPRTELAKPWVNDFFSQVDAMRGMRRTVFDVLPTFFADGSTMQVFSKGLSLAATSIIPGFGGSLAALGVGLAVNFFANNVIKMRVRDHASGANTGR